jgi:hypothetical protein
MGVAYLGILRAMKVFLKSWLKAINDVRLVLGTRLEITDSSERYNDSQEDEPGMHLYNYLTFLQGTLLDALT